MRGRLWVGCMVGVGLAAASLALAGEKAKEGAKERSPEVQRIVSAAREESRVMEHLDVLCNGIGPRLTGSDQLTEACEWVRDRFIEFGIDNARLEQWGEFPVGFNRGPWFGRVIEPQPQALEFVTMAWSAGTRGAVRGKAILAPKDQKELDEAKAKGSLSRRLGHHAPTAAPGHGRLRRPARRYPEEGRDAQGRDAQGAGRQGGPAARSGLHARRSARRWRPPRWPASSMPRSASCS